MRRSATIAAALLLSGCQSGGEAPANKASPSAPGTAASPAAPPAAEPVPQLKATAATAGRWDLQASGEGTALALLSASGATAIRLFCPAGGKTLLVNVPGFRPIGSEERLSFGSGGTVTALVADTRGDRERGGVSATAPAPAELAALLADPVSASYGTQASGPHAPPAPDVARAFVAACRKGAAADPASAAKTAGPDPCNTQGDGRLAVRPIRAVGTEPFWSASIDGRCVTYSHPEDQKGTRIWTRFKPGPGGGTWSGAYAGTAFELTIRPAPGCSDGMSDRRYPMAVDLLVGGERRSGCVHPL